MGDQVKKPLSWIKALLEDNDVTYQIVGGMAATIHGGSRPIADIDLYIPKSQVDRILPLLTPYISKPLTHYKEGAWDLEYLQLIYHSQKIEIGLAPGTRIQCPENGSWHVLNIDFDRSEIKKFKGIEVAVIPAEDLIAYKRILAREVDLIDIKELESRLAPEQSI